MFREGQSDPRQLFPVRRNRDAVPGLGDQFVGTLVNRDDLPNTILHQRDQLDEAFFHFRHSQMPCDIVPHVRSC